MSRRLAVVNRDAAGKEVSHNRTGGARPQNIGHTIRVFFCLVL